MEFPDDLYRDACSVKTLYSPKEGFFNDFVDAMLGEVDKNWIENVFNKENSDVDKIRNCCHDVKVWSALRGILKNISKVYRKKSVEGAEQCLAEGDLLFKLGEYKKAVMVYSQSLIRAPPIQDGANPISTVLPLAFMRRANVLFSLGRFKQCISDLNMALKEKIPDALQHQIFRKLGESYRNISENNKAQISFRIALKLLDEQVLKLENSQIQRRKPQKNVVSIEEIRREIKEIKKIMESEEEKKTDAQDEDSPYAGPLPEKTGAPNAKYPNASNLVKIMQSEEVGRFAAAAGKIEVGDTLVVEEPHASVLISPMLSSHCLHCFTRLFAPIPCRTCSGVAFCSIQCRDAAMSSYHKYECELLGLFLGSGMSVLSHLALRMVTQKSLLFFKTLLSKLKESSAREAFTSEETQYMQVYNLTTHSKLRTSRDYFRRALMAIFLVESLKKTEFFRKSEKGGPEDTEQFSEDEILTASVIFHHLQLLQFNAHEIYETRMPRLNQIKDSKAVYIAVAIYPTVALFNHECAPSVTRFFNGKNIVIKAICPLETNDILSENYGPHYGKKTLLERTRELTSRYWFNCRCKACLEDWPKIENLNEDNLQFRCSTPHCSGTFSQTKLKKNLRGDHSCWICSKKTNFFHVFQLKSKSDNLFEKGLDLMERGQHDEAMTLLIAYLNKTFQTVAPPCRDIFLGQEALRTWYARTGNVWILNE